MSYVMTPIQPNAISAIEIATDAVGASEIATGAVGASEIATGAVANAELAANAVTADKIANNAVGASEIASGAIGSEIAAIGTNSIGSYVLARALTNKTFGDTVAGSALSPAGTRNTLDVDLVEDLTVTLSGTWRCMGGNQDGTVDLLTLWKRIS